MNWGFDCALKLLTITLQDRMITLVFESTCTCVCEWVHWMPVHHASLWWSLILSHCDTYILYPRGLCTLVQKITKIFVIKVQPMTKSTKWDLEKVWFILKNHQGITFHLPQNSVYFEKKIKQVTSCTSNSLRKNTLLVRKPEQYGLQLNPGKTYK